MNSVVSFIIVKKSDWFNYLQVYNKHNVYTSTNILSHYVSLPCPGVVVNVALDFTELSQSDKEVFLCHMCLCATVLVIHDAYVYALL